MEYNPSNDIIGLIEELKPEKYFDAFTQSKERAAATQRLISYIRPVPQQS